MFTGIAMKQRVNGVILNSVEMLKNFSIASFFKNCWKIWIRDQNLKIEKLSVEI